MERGISLVFHHFTHFGLEMHMGSTQLDTGEENQALAAKKMKESHNNKCKREEDKYIILTEIKQILIADGFVTFCSHLKYLGSCISFLLQNEFDVKNRISAANTSMGVMKNY